MTRLIEEAYARLSELEKARWTRAANVAQDEERTAIERALAHDVTTLLIQVSRAREAELNKREDDDGS